MKRKVGGDEVMQRWPGEPGLGSSYSHAEREALMRVLEQVSTWTAGYERRHQEAFESAFAAAASASHAIAVNSGGVALDMAVRALAAPPGGEVVSCAINFPGTHLAVLGAGLRLVLAEPDPSTLNLDPAEVHRRMTRRTVAVLVTHMNGLPADVTAIEALAAERAARLGITAPRIIIDAARAVGAATPAGPVGSQGWVTIFSFHRKKAMTTLGEGGMLTTQCPDTARRLRQMRSFGDRESWGSSYRMTEFQAAVGLEQLHKLNAMNDKRISLARKRSQMLMGLPGGGTLTLPAEPPGYRHVFYLYNVMLGANTPPTARDRLRQLLLQRHGLGTVIANPPTYATHRLIRTHTADQGPLPLAEATAGRLICLPVHPLMTDEDNTWIAEELAETLPVACGA
jgi:perosamine synthetase